MEKINFSLDINAPKEKVWKVLWDADTYTKWTGVFAEGSQAVTDWEEGSKVLFTDGTLKGLIELCEIRFGQNLALYKIERKERGQETAIEDEYYCRIRSLKNTNRGSGINIASKGRQRTFMSTSMVRQP